MIYLYCFYLSMIFISPNLYSLITGNRDKFIGFSEILMPVLFFLNIALILFLYSRKKHLFIVFTRNIDKSAKMVITPLFFLYIVGIIGLIWTHYYDNETISFLSKYSLNLFLFLQMIYLFAYYMYSTKGFIKLVFKTLSITMTIVIFINLLELFYPKIIHTIFAYEYTEEIHERFGFLRLSGSVGVPNTNAIVLYFFTAYVLAFYLREKNLMNNLLFRTPILFLLGIILLLTGSRAGMLAFILQVFFLIYLKTKKVALYWKVQIFILFCLVLINSSLLFIFNYFNYIDSVIKRIGFSHTAYAKEMYTIFPNLYFLPSGLVERLFFVYKGIEAYMNFTIMQKIFGVGLNASGNLFLEITGLPLSSVHNSFVEYLILTGILGFIIYLVLIFKIFVYIKKGRSLTYSGNMLYLFLIALLVHSFFESNFLFNFKSMQIFLFFFAFYIAERIIIKRKV